MAGFASVGMLFLSALLVLPPSQANYKSISLDMTGRDCNMAEREISDSEIYTLYAEYQSNIKPTMDHCYVTLRTSIRNRRLRYIVDRLTIFDCGVEIWIYNNPEITNRPTRVLTCKDDKEGIIQGTTSMNVIMVSLRKQTTSTNAFYFQLRITTDFGPSIEFEKNDSEFYEQPLDTGAIVGIAIAGAILIIALVGLAIYCCLRNRMENKYPPEASEASGPSVFTSGTSQVIFPSHHQRKAGGKYGSMEDIRSNNSSEKGKGAFSNSAYHADEDETKFNRQNSYRRQKGGQNNEAFDEADTRGGSHFSRRDSGRSGKGKGKNYSRREEVEMSKVNKMPNGILKTRSKSPNRSYSSTEGSSVDTNALVYGYNHSTGVHPNTQHIPVIERSRSRSRSRPSSNRSGSTGRSGRHGSVGRAGGKEKNPHTGREYADMSAFLQEPKKQRPRSRSSGSMSRRRADSRTSENVPSEVSFASSKKTTGGKRVHIQGVESDI